MTSTVLDRSRVGFGDAPLDTDADELSPTWRPARPLTRSRILFIRLSGLGVTGALFAVSWTEHICH